MLTTLAIFNFGFGEMVLLGLLGLLIFGKRLPEVGRSLGKGIVEFKRGLAGVEEDANKAATQPAPVVEAPRQLPAPSAAAAMEAEVRAAEEELRAAQARLQAAQQKPPRA